ncbi:MAG: universal stress protein [Solirubrobacterales bacterium]|nr:universal stress protein [Solirubrobacterales bacterium]
MFDNVVVGVRSECAGRDAMALAKQLVSPEGELILVHVHVVPSAPDAVSARNAEKCRYAVARLTALARASLITAHVSCVEARSIRRGLHEFSSRRRADLLVVSASHRDELGRDFISDNVRQVLEDAPCPVAIAPSGYGARVDAMTTIGVAYDGSAESKQALRLARSLAAERDADVSAFEAVGSPVYVHNSWDVREQFEAPVEEARQRLAALRDLDAQARFGDQVDELSRYEQSVDLLVIGSHKYRRIDRLLQSSTAQRLADNPSAPLLVLSAAA